VLEVKNGDEDRVSLIMVMDRQKNKTRSESRRYRVAGRLKVRAGRKVWQAGSESGQARAKNRED
jgi:hypothetical protein